MLNRRFLLAGHGIACHSIALHWNRSKCMHKPIDWDGVLNNHVRAQFAGRASVRATLYNYSPFKKEPKFCFIVWQHIEYIINISISTNCWLNNYNYVLCGCVLIWKESTQNNECFVDDDDDNNEEKKILRIIKQKKWFIRNDDKNISLQTALS